MLNPEQLQTFVAVADTGSFSAAAARLGFTQPAVSRQIKALEGALGEVRLFRRVGKVVRLTHAGEELLAHAHDVVDLLARTEQHMHGLRGQMTGRIVLGCTPDGSQQVVAALLGAFHGKQPGVQFAVDIAVSDDLLGWLDSGQVQAVVLDTEPRRRAYDVVELDREPVVVVCAHGHPLRTKAAVSLVDVVEQHLIMPPRGVTLRRHLDDLLRRYGSEVRSTQIVLETSSVLATLHGVRTGLGVAFVPQPAVALVPDVAVLPVANLALEQPWYLVRQRGAAPHRAMDALWSFTGALRGAPGTEESTPPENR